MARSIAGRITGWFNGMATCPRCGHFLGECHRCQGVWQLRVRVWSRVFSGLLVGALVAVGASVATHNGLSLSAVALAALTGGIVSSAYMRGEPH